MINATRMWAGFLIPFAIFSLLLLLGGCASGQSVVTKANGLVPAGTGFTELQLASGRKFHVFIPADYKSDRAYPAIVFLHGLGEAGSDDFKNLSVGLGPVIAEKADKFGYITIFPQSTGSWEYGSADVRDALASLDFTATKYNLDPKRIHLMGLSTGGQGVWTVAATDPSRFASLFAMCGWGFTEAVPKIKGIPTYIVHNSMDPIVFTVNSDTMASKLKEAGADVTYTKYGAIGHDCWGRALSDPASFAWLAKQSKP
jgi:predicted peptidase